MSASSAIASSASSPMRSSNACLVELADVRRHLVEALVARQLAARRRRLLRLVDGVEGLLALLQPGEGPVGAFAFPVLAPSPSGRVVPNTSPHSSVMISSRRAQASLAQADPAGEGDEDRVEPDGRCRDRLLAQRGERRTRRRVASSAPRTDEPTRRSGCERVRRTSSTIFSSQRVVGRRDGAGDDRLLLLGRLVVDAEAADPVVDGARDARRADGVERVHRRHEPEPRVGHDAPEAGHVQLALAHHRDEHVERLLRHPVELLDVEQGAVAHGGDQRPVDEDVGVVALGEDPGRIEVADEAGRRQLGVALDELEADAELGGDGAQQRRLAGARRALDEDVAPGVEGGEHELELASPPDEPVAEAGQRGASPTGVSHRP